MFEVKIGKELVVNEQGTAEVRYKVRFKNKSNQPQPVASFGIKESTSDVVNIRVKDSKDKSLPYVKTVEEDFVGVAVDLQRITLGVDKTYDLTLRYTIPSMVSRFDHTYFCKEVLVHSHPLAETCEWIITYTLPKLFSKYEFWKETYVNAPQASKIYTEYGRKVIEHQIVVPKASHREFSFMFQERLNSKIITLLSFLLGVGLIQLVEWLIGRIV